METVEMTREELAIECALLNGWKYKRRYSGQKLKYAAWVWKQGKRGDLDFKQIEIWHIPDFENDSNLCDMLLGDFDWFDMRNLLTHHAGPRVRLSYQLRSSETPNTVYYATEATTKNRAIMVAYYEAKTGKRVVVKDE